MSNPLYDIPPALKRQCKNGSPALQLFYKNYFVQPYGLSRREVDLGFLNELTAQERRIAKDLIRRNLDRGYDYIIEGAAALHDFEAMPQLRQMYSKESSLSRRLIIAGALWKLDCEPAFVECLREMVQSNQQTMKEAHLYQIAWLSDERAIKLLIDLLGDEGQFVRYLALSILNSIEFKTVFVGTKLPHSAQDYFDRRDDSGFLTMMVNNLIQSNNRDCFAG